MHHYYFSHTRSKASLYSVGNKLIPLWCWLLFALASPPAWSLSGQLVADSPSSTAGYFVVSWEVSDGGPGLLLQQSLSPNFSATRDWPVPGEGQLTMTGLKDGKYYYRLVDQHGGSLAPVTVTVAHHSLARAGGFFGVGLMLFIILIMTIVLGERQIREQPGG